jgi:hypothetical protein
MMVSVILMGVGKNKEEEEKNNYIKKRKYLIKILDANRFIFFFFFDKLFKFHKVGFAL